MSGTFSCIDHSGDKAEILASVDLAGIQASLDALVKVAEVIGRREPAYVEVKPAEVQVLPPSINVTAAKQEPAVVNLTMPPANPAPVTVSQQLDKRVFAMFCGVIACDILVRAVELIMRFRG